MNDLDNFQWPDVVISDADVGKDYVDQINSTHERSWHIIKMMEDHIGGQRPKDPRTLKEEGKSWANNWNYGKARAKLEKTTAENIDTVLNACSMMSVTFKEPTEQQLSDEDYAWATHPELKDTFSEFIELNLNKLIDEQARLLTWINTIEYNATCWGWCPIVKDKRLDWMGQPQHIRTIGFPKKTKLEDINSFVVFDTINADKLWRTWQGLGILEAKTDSKQETYHQAPNGYIKEGLEEALYHSYNGRFTSEGGTLHNFEEIVPDFVSNCNSVLMNTDSVRIATIYHIEMDGKRYTKTLLAYGNGWKSEKDTNYRHGPKHAHRMVDYSPRFLLYQQTEPIEDLNEILSVVVDSGFTTDCTLQEMRGLGRYAVEDSLRFNRKKNTIEDKLLFSGSPFLRKSAAGTGDLGPKIYPSQGFNVIGSGYDFVVDQPRFDLNGHLVSMSTDENDYNREVQHYDPSLSGRLSSRPVTAEVNAKRAEVDRIEGSKLNIKLKSYSDVFLGMIKSLAYHVGNSTDSQLSGAAKVGFESFKTKILHDLKPWNIDTDHKLKKVLDLVDKVVMESVLINPDAIIEQLNLATTPYRRKRLQRMLALSRGFSRKEINILHPVEEVPDSLSQAKFAAMENLMFKDTVEVVFQESDDHLGHLDFHLPKAFSLIEQLQQTQDDPVPLYNWLARLTEHSGLHVEGLMNLPYINDGIKTKYLENYQQLLQAQAQIRDIIEEMASNIEPPVDQEQPTEGQLETQAKIQMDWAKLENRERIAQIRSDFRAEEMRKNNQFKRQIKQEEHEDKRQRQSEMAALKREIEVMKANIQLL